MEPINTRWFTVKGNLECGFTPDVSTVYESIANLNVELWQKSPIDIIFLGRGITDENGDFTVEFEVEGTPPYLIDGKISDVFMKVYYNDTLISGGNPY